MKLVVLSNSDQFKAFESHYSFDDFQIYCDNGRFFEFLEKRKVAFSVLDELKLRDQWRQINTWACHTALQWIRISSDYGLFKNLDIPSIFFLFLSHHLAHMLKNYHYAKLLLSKDDVSSVLVFETENLPSYPKFSGNIYLNEILRELCVQRNIPSTSLKVKDNFYSVAVTLSLSSQAPFKSFIRKTVQKICGRFFQREQKCDILANGSLKHLASTIKELGNKNVRVAIYNEEFNFQHFRFAFTNGLPYLLKKSSQTDSDQHRRFVQTVKDEIQQALALAQKKGLFVYDHHDFYEFIRKQIFSTTDWYLLKLSEWFSQYEELFARTQASGIMSEEDYGLRAPLAAYAKKNKINYFCLSHATLEIDFKVPEESQVFHHSHTFVNSEYEKQIYVRRGWDPRGILVTGIPRYDRLLNLRAQKQTRKQNSGSSLKLLYCANTFLMPHSPDRFGYLGIDVTNYKNVVKAAAVQIMEAIQDFPLELIIKPHNIEGLHMWKDFLSQFPTSNKIKLITNPHADFFHLLRDCDAMILSYWSTAIIEAALCQLPIIYVDAVGLSSPTIQQYAHEGLCYKTKTVEELKDVLSKINSIKARSINPSTEEYYLGKSRDRQSSNRVAQFIADKIVNKDYVIPERFNRGSTVVDSRLKHAGMTSKEEMMT